MASSCTGWSPVVMRRATPGAHARERPRDDLVALAARVQCRGAGEGRVDLLLPVRGVVVLGEVLEVRREVLDLHAERAHAESGASPQNPPPLGESNCSTLLTVMSDISVPSFLSQSFEGGLP